MSKMLVMLNVLFLMTIEFPTLVISDVLSEEPNYGVDWSYPIHHYLDAKSAPVGKERYDHMIKGCYDKYSKRECDATERARLQMNLDQPAHQHNYTEIGFKKLKVPAAAWEPLLQFYNQNKNKLKPENWPRGNTYTNHWHAPTQMISLEDRQLRGGYDVKNKVWAAMKPILEEWTGHKLTPTSMYGIRVYGDGAMLSTHVDRLPLVSSCIIQVDQDVDEPWPIEVFGHDGKAYNVTMQPGDATLYESHTVLHGRPFPMKGKLYANLFVHFQPVDHDQMNKEDIKKENEARNWAKNKLSQLFTSSHSDVSDTTKHVGGHEQENHDEELVKLHLEKIDQEEALAAAEGINAEKVKLARLKLHEKISAHKAAEEAELARIAAEKRKQKEEQKEREKEKEKEATVAKKMTETVSDIAKSHPARRPTESARFARSFAPVGGTGTGAGTGAGAGSTTSYSGGSVVDHKDDNDAAPKKRRIIHQHVGDQAHFDSDKAMMKETANELADLAAQQGDTAHEEQLRDAASRGDFDALTELLTEQHVHLIHRRDENEWQLLHEAVRSGDLKSVKLLIDMGADVSAKVLSGGAALWIAKYYLEPDHPVTNYLREIGAPDDGLEL